MKRSTTFHRIAFILMIPILSLVFNACNQTTQQTTEIELGYVLWDSEIASTHVVAALIEDSLGHDVELTSVDAGPMWMGIGRGDFDAIVAAWLPVTHEAYLAETEDKIVNLGPNLEGAKLGWVVPEYVTISSIEELPEHAEKFNEQIIGIDPGAGLMAASENVMEEYGLEDYTLVSGSDAAMTAALKRAIEREEWIVVTGWTPHWMFAAHDLKYLEDPKGVLGDVEHIATIVTPELQEKAPDAYELLDNFFWTSDDMAEVMMMIESGMEPMDAARKWIAENPQKVTQWIP